MKVKNDWFIVRSKGLETVSCEGRTVTLPGREERSGSGPAWEKGSLVTKKIPHAMRVIARKTQSELGGGWHE